ncbi:MAG TPA: WhiB family transcriptional regulator [Dermatophilaceae bacterium]|jgi:WhiB family redox-sensing transcriptional regulator|nr:WhiB family transcriptional regulator [Dermatophilaceae bacterium]HOF36876.1 WhiB family transcriptional regulator [Dermatophilaceae bacterium]HPK89434.1 WhiB family transcriptional regulator [Dermatophilaceae bacterium]HQG11115.1 WhiB family transcriptional regulator [Dermatophilaceae bacterium]HQH90389.1 WhiB family transcriptional regulator [Dermatophilaceae bacterium]
MTDTTSPHDRLAFALARLLANGSRPPCADGSGAWTSDDRDERALAARLCRPCPILTECGAAADSTKERFGVWAGVDRTQPTSSKRKGAA